MDAVNKTLLAVCLSLFSAIACAQETAAPHEPYAPTEEEILQVATGRMTAALAALEQGAKECSKAGLRVLDPALFKAVTLSDREWRLALGNLSSSAFDRCVEDNPLWGRALTALMQFKAAEIYYKGKNTIKTRYYPEDLCCAAWRARISTGLMYQKLDPQARKALESIPELSEPFDFVATGDALRVMKKLEREK